jgi:hypothetical protein
VSEEDDESARPEVVDFDALNAALGGAVDGASPASPDSEGRSSATYASARPHAIPATRAPMTVPDEPAVIVQGEDTPRVGPPRMTAPLGAPPPSPPTPTAPAVFVRQVTDEFLAAEAKSTLPMPHRPRRPGGQTIVLTQVQGPTRQQKAAVFIAMLVIVVSTGLAVLAYLRPDVLNLGHRGRSLGGDQGGVPAQLGR